jgi:ASC-1-like (ASCH) protein
MEKIKKENKQKKHRLVFAKENKDTWENIKVGLKTIETRAGSVKYKKVKKGDILVLFCDGKQFERTVKKVTHVTSVAALIKKYNPSSINPGVHTLKEMEGMYYRYPGYKEKIAQFGILAFELE